MTHFDFDHLSPEQALKLLINIKNKQGVVDIVNYLRSDDPALHDFKKLEPDSQRVISHDFYGALARDKQKPPEGNWSVWVVRAGRGFGKTRTGAAWVHQRAMEQPNRWIALVARTPADARDYMILGPGGLMKNIDPTIGVVYQPSNRSIIWPNGSHATIYSDEVPDQLRGFSGDTAWLDEFAKYKNPGDTWDNLVFGMREKSTDQPRTLITTTPRPIPILKQIEALAGTIVVTGSSYENESNLSGKFFETLKRYEGTRFGRQEIHAEIVDDLPGALWTHAMLDKNRIAKDKMPSMVRVVVGVDPSGTSGTDDEKSNSVGIVVVGLGDDDCGYVLADFTCSLSPAGWGRRVIEAYTAYEADKIVVERNFGGAMAEHVIRTADKNAPIKMVTASKGKIPRAEPIASLYEQEPPRMRHVGTFAELEDQLCAFLPEGYAEEGSPDRADAMVWAATELMLQKPWMTPSLQVGLPIFR